MRKSALLALSAALGSLLSAPAYSENSAQQTMKSIAQQQAAPAFALPDLDGETRRLEDFRGKVVAVNFWATWCPPCREELPSMQRTYETFRDSGFEILGVNVGETWETVAPFLENFSLEYPILLDGDSSAMGQWSVMGLPTTFIVDRQGNITHKITGGRNWDDPGFRRQLGDIIHAKSGE